MICTPLVSVVIPCHNYGQFLSESIESALRQTYPNKEVIVVDDESTDGTYEVAMRHSAQVKYVYTKHRGSATPAHAHNVGLRHCRGDFVIFLDADDKLDPDYIQKCFAAFRTAKRNVGFVWTGYQAFGTVDSMYLPRMDVLTRFNCYWPEGQLGAMLVPKRVHEIVGEYDESLHGFEDMDWAIRACNKGFVGISVKEPLHYYRFHGTSVNSNAKGMQAIKELYRKHPRVYLLRIAYFWTRGLRTYVKENSRAVKENSRAKIHLYNAIVPRFFHGSRLVEPPENTQHVWVNERSILRKVTGNRVLDCGCGVGRWGWLLNKRYTVTGVDLTRGYLKQAKALKCYDGLVQAHLSYLPFREDYFDTILASEVIEYLTYEEGLKFLHQLQGLGKRLVLTTPKELDPLNYVQGCPETIKSVWSKEQILSCLLGKM